MYSAMFKTIWINCVQNYPPILDKEAHMLWRWEDLTNSWYYILYHMHSVSSMKRAILLQTDEVTVKQDRIPRDFSLEAAVEFDRLLDERDFRNTFMDFHPPHLWAGSSQTHKFLSGQNIIGGVFDKGCFSGQD